MINRLVICKFSLYPSTVALRAIIGMLLMVVLASCASQSARDAELAAQEAERVAMQQQAAELAQQQERVRAAELQRQREQQAAERARVQAERDRQLAQARARAEAERQQREAAEQRETARLAAIAAAEAERQQKIDRIAALEQQIASIQTQVVDEESRRGNLEEAIVVAEELLTVLTAEQAKYENTDADGNTVDPLAKELIAELESRKNELLRQAGSR